MELEKDLLDFVRHIVKMKKQYALVEKKYMYADKYTVVVLDILGFDKRHLIRVGLETGQVQVKKDLLAFSDMGLFFWLVWGLVLKSSNSGSLDDISASSADTIALNAMFSEYAGATNTDINGFYLEFNKIMELCPTDKNLKRSEYVFDRVSNKLISNITNAIG